MSLDNAKEQGHSLRVENNQNFLEEVDESIEILDSVMFRGLSLNRRENRDPS